MGGASTRMPRPHQCPFKFLAPMLFHMCTCAAALLFSKKMKVLLSFFLFTIASNMVSGQRNTNLTKLARCGNVAVGNGCSISAITSAIRSSLDTAIICNSSNDAVNYANECARSSGGVYCGAASLYSSDIATAGQNCSDIINSGFQANCSDECRTALEGLRSSLGCCINIIYNRTQTPSYFNYHLWLRCGVATPPKSCSAGNTISYIFTPEKNCNYTELQHRLLRSHCISYRQTQIRNALSGMTGCNSYLQYFNELCSVDSSDKYCISVHNFTYILERYLLPIQQNCYDSGAINCTSRCNTSLTWFTNERGCCINVLFNSTLSEVLGFYNSSIFRTASLYQACGIKTPPLTCKTGLVYPTSNGATAKIGGIVLVLIVAAASFLLLHLN